MSRMKAVIINTFYKHLRENKLTLLLIINLFFITFVVSDVFWLSKTRMTFKIYLSRLGFLTVVNAMIVSSNIVWSDFKNKTIIVYVSHALDSFSYVIGVIMYSVVVQTIIIAIFSMICIFLNISHFVHYIGIVFISFLSYMLLFTLFVGFMVFLSFFIPENGNSFMFLLVFIGLPLLRFIVDSELLITVLSWVHLAIPNMEMLINIKGKLLNKSSIYLNLFYLVLLTCSYLFFSVIYFDKAKKVWK